jgi:alanine racemase
VDLDALQSNLRRLRRLLPKRVSILFVVKADGYGHGAVRVSKAALESGTIDGLGVSSVEEGILLRDAGLRRPVLILGSLYPFESTLAAVRYNLSVTAASFDGARLIAQAARRAYGPARRFRRLRCHLKLDTGMGRIGVSWPAGLKVAERLAAAKDVDFAGVYTHFSSADSDSESTAEQARRFREALRELEGAGLRPRLAHAANSAGALLYPEARFDGVRPGLAAYGLWPGFKPALSLKTRIVFLKNMKAGMPISYGGRYKTRAASKIATLPIGYADGLPRAVSGKGQVLVRGRRCPIVGAVTMDMTMIDVSSVPEACVGDEAVLIGSQGSEQIQAGELAAWAGTISYEVLTGLKSRVPRVYLREKK